jgi:hypothetical protein
VRDEHHVTGSVGDCDGGCDFLDGVHTSGAQRAPLGKVQSLEATSDGSGSHPASAAIAALAKITCLNAMSEAPNSKPVLSCHVVARGFTGNLAKGESKGLATSGNVTLTCNGQGPRLRCTARVDIPPPSH